MVRPFDEGGGGPAAGGAGAPPRGGRTRTRRERRSGGVRLSLTTLTSLHGTRPLKIRELGRIVKPTWTFGARLVAPTVRRSRVGDKGSGGRVEVPPPATLSRSHLS